MSSFDWLKALLLFGVLQGGLLVVAINRLPQRNKTANRILSVFILLITVTLLWRLVDTQGVVQLIAGIIQDEIIFLYGPVFYLYTKALLTTGQISFKQWRLHLIPAGVYLVLQPLMWQAKSFWLPFMAFSVMAAITHSTIYIIKSYQLVRNFKRKSTKSSPYIGYLQTMIVLLSVCLVLATYLMLAFFFDLPYQGIYVNYQVIWFSVSIITYVVGYFAMFSPEIFKVSSEDIIPKSPLTITKTPSAKKIIASEDLKIWKTQLITVMDQQKPYLNPKLTLGDLAGLMTLEKVLVSRVIHEGFGQNFYDFVNTYRIEHFVRLSQDKAYQHYTSLALAYEVGFNAKSTFHQAFKKIKNTTPKAYLASLTIE